MQRVLIIGSAGAGKSTLARRLGVITGLPVVHLDAHYWNAGWRPTPPDEWTQRVAELLRGDAWIIDGNYSATLTERVDAADTVILLELSRLRCLYRVFVRGIRHRGRARADLHPDCPEQLPDLEFIRWIWGYPRRSLPRVRAILRERAGGRTIVVLKSPAEIERYLESVDAAMSGPAATPASANRRR